MPTPRVLPCLCGALNIHPVEDPPPSACARCGRSDRFVRPPTPTPLAAPRESVARRVFIDGDPEAI